MLIAIAVGAGLVGYLNLSYTTLKLSQRTFYLNCASNLAEAGLEEAVYCCRLMNAGTAASAAWTGWTISGSNATFTLPAFSCSQNAVGVVKVYVSGYDGTAVSPAIFSQSTVTPLDGSPPVRKTLKVTFSVGGTFQNLIATNANLSLNPNNTVDSWNSNPTNSPSAPRLPYTSSIAAAAANLLSTSGTISLGNKSVVNGSVSVSKGVTPPAQSQVTGTISTSYAGSALATPAAPTWSSSTTGYYSLTSFPATLPRAGDVPGADGRYHYFPATTATLGAVAITTGKNVAISATTVSSSQITVNTGSTLEIYSGNVSVSAITNSNWAGALKFSSWGTSFSIPYDGTYAAVYAPLADISMTGGGSNKNFYGAIVAKSVSTVGGWALHYDESLVNIAMPAASSGALKKWYDLQGTTESQTLATLTGGFLK